MSKTLALSVVLICLAIVPAFADQINNQSETSKTLQTPVVSPDDPALETQTSEADLLIDDETTEEVDVELGVLNKPQDTKEKSESTDDPQVTLAKQDQDAPLTDKQKAQKARRDRLAKEALSYRGTPYVWGGTGRGGFDCSGFTQYLYEKRGIKLPHSAKLQFKKGKPISRDNLQAGDLVFFNTRGPITHVGMYIGDGKFIHAANKRRGVIVSSMDEPYYAKRYAGARRYSK